MTYPLSAEERRAMCAVLGLTREMPDRRGISDGALVLFLVLVLTKKPPASEDERAKGGTYHDDPAARCHDELSRKVGPARTGAKGARDTVIAADAELDDLELIVRERVENELGRTEGRHTPYRRTLRPENGVCVEVPDAVLDFVAAVVRDPKLSANRKAQAVRLAANTGLSLSGENDVLAEALGMTWKAVKGFLSDMREVGYAHLQEHPPALGKRRRWTYTLQLRLPRGAEGNMASQPAAPVSTNAAPSSVAPETIVFPPAPGATAEAAPTTPEEDWTALVQTESTKLWQGVRERVAEAIRLVELQLAAGQTLSDRERVTKFIRPVLAIQADKRRYNPPALKAALRVTLENKSGPCHGPNGANRFENYLQSTFVAKLPHYVGASASEPTNAAVERSQSIQARETATRELLREAYALNKGGRRADALKLLDDMLARAKFLAELFDGDEARTKEALRLAFKQGSSDFVAARPNPYAPVDYLPDWDLVAA